jgi:phosphoglycolate phosphatase
MGPSPSIDGPVGGVDALVGDREAVVFDMDGTLLVLAAPWKRLRRELAEFLEPEVMPTGPERPASETLRDLREAGRRDDVERVLDRLREAELAGVEGSSPVPEGLHMLEQVEAARVPAAVVSNNCQDAVDAALDRHGLRARFEIVVGLGATEDLKPEPAGLLDVLDDLGAAPGEALFVGDDWKDFEAGAKAGVPTVDVADLPGPDG